MCLDKTYAVNLADLTTHARPEDGFTPTRLLLTPLLLKEQIVHCEGNRWDGAAVLVRSDIDQSRWDAVVKILREGTGNIKAIPKHSLRIYESKTGRGSWKRI